MIYYTVYKTTNLLNGKIYIGAHKTENLNDTYLGSGTDISAAIEEFGEENFKKETLMLFDTEEEAYFNESLVVTKEFIKEDTNYNLTPGGKRPPNVTGIKRGDEAKENYRKAASRRDSKYEDRIATIRKENNSYEINRVLAKSMGLANKGRKHTEEESKAKSERNKNSKWYTNGIDDRFIHKDTPIPEGFYLGRTKKKNWRKMILNSDNQVL